MKFFEKIKNKFNTMFKKENELENLKGILRPDQELSFKQTLDGFKLEIKQIQENKEPSLPKPEPDKTRSTYSRDYYLANKDKILQQQKEYRKRVKAKQAKREYNKKYYQEHKKQNQEYSKKYYQENKEYFKEYNKKYHQEHKKVK